MKSKPKILFIYDHPNPTMWLDGLSRALDVLEEDFEITRFNFQEQKVGSSKFIKFEYDFYLGWGAFGSLVDKMMQQWQVPKRGLCVAGNATKPEGAENYDVLFYETDWINDNYLPNHPHKVKAFGTNTDLYNTINIPTPIVWDYLGVGALARWKRWDKMLQKKGNRLVIGEYQNQNEAESLSITRTLVRNGVMVSNQINPLDLALLYHYARTIYIPADTNGGGERAILEAKASGCAVEVEPDNAKLQELVELEKVPSHLDYAKALKEGILACL